MSENITKEIQYRDLVKEVSGCIKCDEIKLRKKDGTIIELKHDKCRTQINLWSHWQGSLDADILLIGQDWGRIDNEEEAKYWANKSPYLNTDKNSKDYSVTDNNLRTLFLKSLGIDIAESNKRLFFTNSVQCYKTGSLSNKTSDQWYRICNERYVRRLIHIIKPKMIIPVGVKALYGLKHCGKFYNIHGDIVDESYFTQEFAKIVEGQPLKLRVEIKNEITEVFVCPVFHCGVMSCNLNRKFEQQIKDWQKIKNYL